MPVAPNVRRRLGSAIKKFRFEELETCVMPSFPETSWNRLRLKLIRNHESFTVRNALNFIEDAISEAKVSEKVLNDRIARLEVVDVSRHHHKKTWHTFKMLGPKSENVDLLSDLQIKTKMIQQFEEHQLEVDVKLTDYESITYISIVDKPRGKSKGRQMSPIFFAITMGYEYLFCSRGNVTKEFVQIVVESFDYTSAKKVKLVGKDLNSLMQMLRMKTQGSVDSNDNCDNPTLKIADPVVTSSGIDFRQNKQRREYAEQCFGKEPPTLELLVATGPERPWNDDEIRRKMPHERVQIRWEFRSHNIAAMLTKLAEHRVFVMPLPEYVSNLMTTGRNDLRLEEN